MSCYYKNNKILERQREADEGATVYNCYNVREGRSEIVSWTVLDIVLEHKLLITSPDP